ncbi:complex I assembly factor ACAD9, mitochondrial [Drosophila pseudoobscura]|uniref:Complex I assembly factor ACAD9, mitochondrial n=1 Tax=Drosophila pseudoobscura pseudoobscura TaxID=46245 RepID=A0A6I8UTJ8_DROPS|nr:complex I assembly factor ACAD9, mitochondrial [Drosophila pseudoobscura]
MIRSQLFSGATRLLRYDRTRTLLIRGKGSKATTHSLDAQRQDGGQAAAAGGSEKPGGVQEAADQQKQQQLPARAPLVKNFFIGAVDKELLAYPEVIAREDMSQLQNALLPLKNYFSECKEQEPEQTSGDNLKQLGLYGLNVPTDYDGRGYGWSASLMASEPDSAETSIGLGLQAHRVVVDLLREVGTQQQQQRYLPALGSGQLIATEAIYEYAPPEDDYFFTQATLTPGSNSWLLNGEKAYVVCAPGERQLFLVLAQTQQPNVPGSLGRGTTIFLVDSQQPGVRLGEQHPTIGCRGTQMRRVHFDNVQISEDQVVGLPHDGNRHSEKLVRASRLRSSLVGLSLAKRLLNELTQFSVDTTQCGVHIKDLEMTRVHLSRAMCSVYAMESMLYLTAGLLDEFQGQDVTLESAITKYYTLKQLYAIASDNLGIVGPKSLHSGQPTELGLRDAAQLYTQGESIDTLSMFIALTGLQYAGQAMNSGVRKSRNPLFHPGHIFGKFLETTSVENPKTKMQLSEHVHPSLDAAAQCIEQSVARLQMAVELMFTRHGNAVVERQSEMQRLAEISTTIYAMWASVARASRSYCIGLPLADHELLTATAVCSQGRDVVKTLCTEIFGGNFVNNDNNLVRLSNQLTKSKGYFAVHPLTFNF